MAFCWIVPSAVCVSTTVSSTVPRYSSPSSDEDHVAQHGCALIGGAQLQHAERLAHRQRRSSRVGGGRSPSPNVERGAVDLERQTEVPDARAGGHARQRRRRRATDPAIRTARAPDGPTQIATGISAELIRSARSAMRSRDTTAERLFICRTSACAPFRSARSMASSISLATIGSMMPDTSNTSTGASAEVAASSSGWSCAPPRCRRSHRGRSRARPRQRAR